MFCIQRQRAGPSSLWPSIYLTVTVHPVVSDYWLGPQGNPPCPLGGAYSRMGLGAQNSYPLGQRKLKALWRRQGLSGRVGIRCIDHRPQVGKPRPQEHRCICRLRAAGAGPPGSYPLQVQTLHLRLEFPFVKYPIQSHRQPLGLGQCPPFSLPARGPSWCGGNQADPHLLPGWQHLRPSFAPDPSTLTLFLTFST